MIRPTLVLLLAIVAACGKNEQSFNEGMAALCGSTGSVPSTLSPSEKALEIAKTAEKNVSNQEVRKLATSLAAAEPGHKVSLLRDAATRAGIERCGLLELWSAGAAATATGDPPAGDESAPPAGDESAPPAGDESAAAAGGQSLADGLRIVCQAPDKVPPGSDASAVASYIQANLKNAEATSLMQSLASMPPGERTDELVRVARENGIERCPLAEMK